MGTIIAAGMVLMFVFLSPVLMIDNIDNQQYSYLDKVVYITNLFTVLESIKIFTAIFGFWFLFFFLLKAVKNEQ